MKLIDADAIKEKFAEILESTYTDDYAKGYVNGLRAALNMPTLTPPNEVLTCDGCAEIGKWENEYEYSYPSPCTLCKRRAWDNYRRPPEGEANG